MFIWTRGTEPARELQGLGLGLLADKTGHTKQAG